MSESVRPTARSVALTRADPPLVDPPSQTNSSFAALSSEGTSILRSSRSTREPRCGCSPEHAKDLDRDRDLEGRARRECGASVPRRTGAGAEILDEDRAGSREAAGERANRAREVCVFVPTARRRSRCRLARQSVDGRDRGGGAPVPVGDRRQGETGVALRQRDVEIERGPARADVLPGRDAPVEADDDRLRASGDTPCEAPERDLVRARRDEHRWRQGYGHGPMIAPR